MIRLHAIFGPFLDGRVDSRAWVTRIDFSSTSPSQMNFGHPAIVEGEEHVIAIPAASNCGDGQAEERMSTGKFTA